MATNVNLSPSEDNSSGTDLSDILTEDEEHTSKTQEITTHERIP